jgi:hypothetical protein
MHDNESVGENDVHAKVPVDVFNFQKHLITADLDLGHAHA